jgi:hypothetical protein
MTKWGSIFSFAVAVAITAIAGCVSEDEPSVHLVVAYQLRGANGVGDEHDLDNLDGLGDYELSCELGEKTEDVTFSADYDDGKQRISLKSAKNKKGEVECTLTVKDKNTYERECVIGKSKTVDCSQDTIDSPCRVSIVKKDEDMVQGLICCYAIPIKGKLPRDGDYSIVAPNSVDKPVSFKGYHCVN